MAVLLDELNDLLHLPVAGVHFGEAQKDFEDGLVLEDQLIEFLRVVLVDHALKGVVDLVELLDCVEHLEALLNVGTVAQTLLEL